MNFFQFFKEDNGNFSSMRLFSFLITAAVVVDYMHAVWTVGSWHPDLNLIFILLTAIGGKVAQKFTEGEAKP